MSFFDRAFQIVVGEEGGYVNNPKDPGGETKYGISKRAYPNEDIKNLTLDRAKELYKRDYWDKVKGNSYGTFGEALCVFDCAVNMGVGRALNLAENVNTGPAFVINFQTERLLLYSKMKNWDTFGRGWTRRALRIALLAQAT